MTQRNDAGRASTEGEDGATVLVVSMADLREVLDLDPQVTRGNGVTVATAGELPMDLAVTVRFHVADRVPVELPGTVLLSAGDQTLVQLTASSLGPWHELVAGVRRELGRSAGHRDRSRPMPPSEPPSSRVHPTSENRTVERRPRRELKPVDRRPRRSGTPGVDAAAVTASEARPCASGTESQFQAPGPEQHTPATEAGTLGSFDAVATPEWARHGQTQVRTAHAARRTDPARLEVQTEELAPVSVHTEQLAPTQTRAMPIATFERLPHDEERAAVLAQSSLLMTAWSGAVGERSAAFWLLRATGQGDTGICSLRSGDRTYHLLQIDGEAVDVQVVPQTAAHALAPVLARAEVLEPARVVATDAAARQHGLDLGDVLVASEVVAADAVDQARRARLSFLVQKMLDATHGAFYYTPLVCAPFDVPMARPDMVRMAWKAVTQRLRKLTPAQLGERREPLRNHYPVRADSPPWPVEALPLDSREERFYELSLDGGRRLWEVLTVSNLNKTQSTVVILALRDLGFLVFESELEHTRRDDDIVDAIHRRAVMIDRESEFELVKCHWSAYDEPIEIGFQDAIEELEDERYSPAVLARIRDDLVIIRSHVERAYRSLRTAGQRREARSAVADGLMISNSADLYLKQADMYLMRNELETAVDCFRRVREMDPGNATARAGLARFGRLKPN